MAKGGLSKSTGAMLPWLGLALILLIADQFTKVLILGYYQLGDSTTVTSFFNVVRVHNTGAAFSFLADAGGWQQWLFSALAVIISAVCVVMLAKQPRSDWRMALPLALIVGGALGNLIDRVRFGYVVDFVHWYWRDFHWPVFNLADSAISVAAVLLIVFSFVPDRTPESP